MKKFSLYAEVFDIGDENWILRLTALTDNDFLVESPSLSLRKPFPGLIMICSIG